MEGMSISQRSISPGSRAARRAFLAVLLASGSLALGARAVAQQGAGEASAVDEPVLFEQRGAFVPMAVDAPPIAARRAGAAAEDVYALPVQALGRVDCLSDIDVAVACHRRLTLAT